jgi:hypothetical protein
MSKSVVGFEYEWLNDDSLRLRFLDGDGGILGQQVISAEAVVPLQSLMALALLTLHRPDAETSAKICERLSFDLDPALIDSVFDAVRVRAVLTPDGRIRLDAFHGEES